MLLIPQWDISVNKRQLFRERSREHAMMRAKRLCLSYDGHDLIFRPLLPSDLGLESWLTPEVGREPIPWCDHKFASDCVGVICSAVVLSPDPQVNYLHLPGFFCGEVEDQTVSLDQIMAIVPAINNILAAGTHSAEWLSEYLRDYAGSLVMEGYFSEVCCIDPNQVVKISVSSDRSEHAQDRILFNGYVLGFRW